MNGYASDSQSSRIDMKAQLPGQPSVESESDTDEETGGFPAGAAVEGRRRLTLGGPAPSFAPGYRRDARPPAPRADRRG